jgi:LPXTG-motif cell wall-anchored protein
VRFTRLATTGVAVAFAVLAPIGSALAQGSSEDPARNDRPRERTPAVGAEREQRDATLPLTGGDLVAFAATGAAVVGVGTVLVRRGRRA